MIDLPDEVKSRLTTMKLTGRYDDDIFGILKGIDVSDILGQDRIEEIKEEYNSVIPCQYSAVTVFNIPHISVYTNTDNIDNNSLYWAWGGGVSAGRTIILIGIVE